MFSVISKSVTGVLQGYLLGFNELYNVVTMPQCEANSGFSYKYE